jgi:hypothetical protein
MLLAFPLVTPDAMARCAQDALEIGRSSAAAFCKEVKDAYADQVVIRPTEGVMHEDPGGEQPICTYEDTLLCKNVMARLVGRDRLCATLYRRNISWTVRDDDGNFINSTNAQSFYASMMQGCNLH